MERNAPLILDLGSVDYAIANPPYMADGTPKAVVIPIELWRKLLPQTTNSLEDLPENLEDYCLSKAMDEAIDSPVLSREDAIANCPNSQSSAFPTHEKPLDFNDKNSRG